jgi:hypothetical protein
MTKKLSALNKRRLEKPLASQLVYKTISVPVAHNIHSCVEKVTAADPY